MNDQRRVLFLSFFFPPVHAIAGVRTGNIARQLSALGWDVTVVTLDPSLWQFTDAASIAPGAEERRMKMVYTGYRWKCLSSGTIKRNYARNLKWVIEAVPRRIAKLFGIDEMIGWYPEVMRACASMKPGDFDVILASGSPFGSFRLAERLSRRLQCPFVLDYRDLWSSSPYAKRRASNGVFAAESALLEKCAGVSVVSPSMARVLGDSYGITEKITIVPNGYDKEEMAAIEPHEFGHFAIVYTGQFYPPKSNPDPIMQTIGELKQDATLPAWRFHYYGPHESLVRQSAQRHGVEDVVECHGMVSRHRCLSAVRGAGTAIIITSVLNDSTLQDKGVITGKLYEPIGLGTSVLAITPKGSDVERVFEAVGGGMTFSGADIQGMRAFLSGLIRGSSVFRRPPDAYAWQDLGRQMDAWLRSIVHNEHSDTKR